MVHLVMKTEQLRRDSHAPSHASPPRHLYLPVLTPVAPPSASSKIHTGVFMALPPLNPTTILCSRYELQDDEDGLLWYWKAEDKEGGCVLSEKLMACDCYSSSDVQVFPVLSMREFRDDVCGLVCSWKAYEERVVPWVCKEPPAVFSIPGDVQPIL